MTALVFAISFVVSLVVLLQDQRERRRLHKEAIIRRLKGDTRPLQYREPPPLLWKEKSWFALSGTDRRSA